MQSHTKEKTRTFLAISDTNEHRILGYHSLSIPTDKYAQTPNIVRRGLSKNPVSMDRLCKLALERYVQKQEHGGLLILTSGKRCLQASSYVNGIGLLIDAENPDIADRYPGYGTLPLPDKPLSLMLPFQTIREVLQSAGKL